MSNEMTKELQGRDEAGLTQLLEEKQKHLFVLRSQAVTEKLEDPTQLGKTKREIARIKTVQRQKQLAASATK